MSSPEAAVGRMINQCLACGGDVLDPLLDLGRQPLANSLPTQPETLPAYPLRLNLCPSCFHLQQACVVAPEILFRDYLYASGTSRTLESYFEWFAVHVEEQMEQRGASGPLKVLEIASNDGSLLAQFKSRGHDVLGVDPASNLAPHAREKGIETLCDFWPSAQPLERRFDVIIAMNVLAHVPDPAAFLSACRSALAPGGVVFIQTSQAKMVANGEFDTIYHEHHSFFHTRSLQALAVRAGLVVVGARTTPIHGTSALWMLQEKKDQADESVAALLDKETQMGAYDRKALDQFANRARARARDVARHVAAAQHEMPVAAWGAAAKAVVFINFAGLVPDFIVDDSPLKQGRFLPGCNVPILSSDDACVSDPSPMLWIITAWNFRDEITARLRKRRGQVRDQFMVYFPEIEIWS